MSLKSKSSPATFFPPRQNPVCVAGETVTQRGNGVVRFKKIYINQEKKSKKGRKRTKKTPTESAHLSSLSKTHPGGKIPEEKDTESESSRAGVTPTEPSR